MAGIDFFRVGVGKMDIDPSGLVQGVERVANYDNIAISILFIMCAAEGFLIYFLINKLLSVIDGVKEALKSVDIAVNTLNERIGHD